MNIFLLNLQVDKPKLEDLIQKKNLTNIRGAIASAKTLAKEGSKYMKVVVVSSNLQFVSTLF